MKGVLHNCAEQIYSGNQLTQVRVSENVLLKPIMVRAVQSDDECRDVMGKSKS